jgi:hypothetical protein
MLNARTVPSTNRSFTTRSWLKCCIETLGSILLHHAGIIFETTYLQVKSIAHTYQNEQVNKFKKLLKEQ